MAKTSEERQKVAPEQTGWTDLVLYARHLHCHTDCVLAAMAVPSLTPAPKQDHIGMMHISQSFRSTAVAVGAQ